MNENIRDMLMSNCKEDVELAATLIGENKVPFNTADVKWLYRNTYVRDERWSTLWDYLIKHYEQKYDMFYKCTQNMEATEAIRGRYTFKEGVIDDK